MRDLCGPADFAVLILLRTCPPAGSQIGAAHQGRPPVSPGRPGPAVLQVPNEVNRLRAAETVSASRLVILAATRAASRSASSAATWSGLASSRAAATASSTFRKP